MVHADASNFTSGISKKDGYNKVLEEASALLFGQRNWVCNLANAASLLWHALHSMPGPSKHVNWAGFYVLDPSRPSGGQLILGPFQGKVACQTIKFGRGVCGKAAESGETILVTDTSQFQDHIACDSDSQSEIVVPIKSSDKVVAVIDIDSTVLNTFDEDDKRALESLAWLLGSSCDW